jgi:hypothetical protein
LHLEPANRSAAGVAPGMWNTGRDQSEIAGSERVRLIPNLREHAAFKNVKALFEGVHVKLNRAVRIEEANARAHVNGPHGPIHVRRSAKTEAVRLVELGGLRGGWVDLGDSVHGVWIYYGSYPR